MTDTRGTGGRRRLRALRWIIPALIVVGAIAFRTAAGARVQESSKATPIPVRTVTPERGDLSRVLRLNGHVESQTMVIVLPLVSGVLQELYVDVGQHVRKDQVLARIDSQRFELQLQQAESAYLSSRSAYERVEQLYRANAATQQSYEQAKGQYEAYASQYELAKLQVGYAAVKSPVAGVVLATHLSAGSLTAPERPLLTLGHINDLVVKAKIPEKYYEIFRSGTLVAINVLRPEGAAYGGSIRSISPFISAETRNFETVVAIEGDISVLRPGMFVNMEFELARWRGVCRLPFEALSTSGRLWWVENGTARSEAYVPTQASDEAFVVPDAWADREFVTEGNFFLREGSAVTVLGGPEP
jgi:membrane fusion protein, multidrug efflux system